MAWPKTPKVVAGLVLAAGSIAGALYLRQQHLSGKTERACLYFADGTLLELDPDEEATGELLVFARELIAGAHPESL
jgi:ferric-dicitrate binding protein FerR (iron transport regulator)